MLRWDFVRGVRLLAVVVGVRLCSNGSEVRMGWDMVLGLRSLMDGIFRTMVWCIVNVLWMEGIWET